MQQKKPSPQAGFAGSNGKPQGKGSFLGGVFKRLIGRAADTDGASVNTAKASEVMQHLKIDEEFVRRIHRQNAEIDFLDRVLKASSDAIIVADPNGRITMFNKGAESMFQIDEDIARGDNIFRMCADGSVDSDLISRMLIADQAIKNLRVEILGIAGKRTPALLTIDFVHGHPEGDEKPVPVAIVAIIKDNSALEAAHSELERAHAELKEAYVKVEMLSLTDGLTGLFNRRFFDQKVRDEYERMMRGHMETVSLFVIDIDHFKKFNDTHGHQVGDKVLRLVAEAVKKAVRQIDVACRYGGEEITVILPATNEAEAMVVAERIRNRVAAIRFQVEDGEYVTVTCSIGVQTHREEDGDVETFIREADQAVYLAKQNGRNRAEAHHLEH